jgi:hypothetical protein
MASGGSLSILCERRSRPVGSISDGRGIRGGRARAAATRAERGELSLTRLDYLLAAQHFKSLPVTAYRYHIGPATHRSHAVFVGNYPVIWCDVWDARLTLVLGAQGFPVTVSTLRPMQTARL